MRHNARMEIEAQVTLGITLTGQQYPPPFMDLLPATSLHPDILEDLLRPTALHLTVLDPLPVTSHHLSQEPHVAMTLRMFPVLKKWIHWRRCSQQWARPNLYHPWKVQMEMSQQLCSISSMYKVLCVYLHADTNLSQNWSCTCLFLLYIFTKTDMQKLTTWIQPCHPVRSVF